MSFVLLVTQILRQQTITNCFTLPEFIQFTTFVGTVLIQNPWQLAPNPTAGMNA